MKLTARPSPSITPIQTVSPGPRPAPHGAARSRSMRAASASMRAGASSACASTVHVRRIGDVAVAHRERLLRRLDAQVHVVGAVGIDVARPAARSRMPRISSETTPCVGGGML